MPTRKVTKDTTNALLKIQLKRVEQSQMWLNLLSVSFSLFVCLFSLGIIMCGTDHKTSSMCPYLHISCTHRSQLEENSHTCVAGVACN